MEEDAATKTKGINNIIQHDEFFSPRNTERLRGIEYVPTSRERTKRQLPIAFRPNTC